MYPWGAPAPRPLASGCFSTPARITTAAGAACSPAETAPRCAGFTPRRKPFETFKRLTDVYKVCIIEPGLREHAQPRRHKGIEERRLVRGKSGGEPQAIQTPDKKGKGHSTAPEPGHPDWHSQKRREAGGDQTELTPKRGS